MVVPILVNDEGQGPTALGDDSMTMISYAQNAEDVLLARLFPEGHRGFYIDIGAAHPTFHSVTRHFYDLGWRGINVEPVPAFFGLIEAQRPRDVNLRRAASDSPGLLTFFHAEVSEGESTLSAEEADALRARGLAVDSFEVEATTLREICEAHVPEGTEIDFLKIDVENHEGAVIRGGDWSRWRPRVLVVESDKDTSWEPLLLESGYLYATLDGINRYYVRDEDAGLIPALMSPANCLDGYVPYEHLAPRLDAEARLKVVEAHWKDTDAILTATEARWKDTNEARLAAEANWRGSEARREAAEAGLRASLAEVAARDGALDRAAAEADALRGDLGRANAEVDRLSARTHALSGDLDAERLRNDQMLDHLRDLTASLHAERQRREQAERAHRSLLDRVTLDDGLIPGPALIALANRLRSLAGRYPRAIGRAKRMLRVARP